MQNNLKILHFADLHARRDNIDKVDKALVFIHHTAEERRPDIILFAGDLWDGSVDVNRESPLYSVVDGIKAMSKIAPIAMLQGTPSHDRPGSLDIFSRLETIHTINILKKPQAYCPRQDCMIMPVPGITKANLISWASTRGIDMSPEQADKEAGNLMRAIFQGFRAEYEKLKQGTPFIVPILLGHFTVYGSKTPTGQTMTGGDVVVSTADIAEAGAVYSGLGHIHKAQGWENDRGNNGLIAYSGNVFPQNYGETGQKSITFVELNCEEIISFERIPTPFAPMVDLELVYFPEDTDNQPFRFRNTVSGGGPIDIPEVSPDYCNGADTRVRLYIPPEPKDMVTEKHIIDWFERNSIKPASVKFEKIIEVASRQRCEIINEAETNLDRLKAWADTTGTELSETTGEKLEGVEADLLLTGNADRQASGTIRLKSLRLRGSKGINWTDEININFTNFNSDIILFDGDNGAGKTTTLDNLHPYPWSFYYDGVNGWNAKLADSFRLEDSCRELVVNIDDVDYKFLLKADGVRGRAEYYVYRLIDGEWDSLNDGKKPSYKQKVLELFGSPELFSQTVYQVQGATGLIGREKAELKDMFCEMLGFGEYRAIADKAKEIAGGIKSDIDILESKIADGKKAAEGIEEAWSRIDGLRNAIERETNSKNYSEKALESLTAKLKELEKRAATQESITSQAAELTDRIEKLEAERDSNQAKFESWKPKQEAKIKSLKGRIAENDELLAQKDKITGMVQHREKADELRAKIKDFSHEIASIDNEIKSAKHKRQSEHHEAESEKKRDEDLLQQQKELAEKLKDVPCQNFDNFEGRPGYAIALQWAVEKCQECPLIANALQAQEDIPETEGIIDNDECDMKFALERMEEETKELNEKKKPLKDEHDRLAKELAGIPDEANTIDWKSKQAKLDTAQSMIAELQLQVAGSEKALNEHKADYDKLIPNLQAEIDELEEKRKLFASQIDSDVAKEISHLNGEILTIKNSIKAADNLILEAEKSKAASEARLNELRETEILTKERECKLSVLRRDYSEYVILQTAFSRNGVPSLLLESALPQISEYANDLLTEFNRQICFETIRDKADGKGVIDTFDILVIDESGKRPIKLLSGGQKVPIVVAMQSAIAIYRGQQSGFNPMFALVDECDSALRSVWASALFDMLQKRMRLGGLETILLVSHREELAEQCAQKIVYDTAAGQLKEVY